MSGRWSVNIIVPAMTILVAAGCVEREPEESSQREPVNQAELTESDATSERADEAAVDYETLDGTPCSWKEIVDPAPSEPFEDLAWKSHQVAVGTVVDEAGPDWLEPDPRHPGRPGQCLHIMTDYFVEIETHYRGQEADPLRVRVRGGQIDDYEQRTDVSPDLEVGDRLLMFLSEAPASGVLPDAFLAHDNRVWQIDDNDRVTGDEWLDDFDVLNLESVDERIRDVLGRQSHILGTRNVTPDEAPIHVERDEDRGPIAGTPCTFRIDFDLDPHPPIEDLTWGSGQIVVGTVTEDLGPDWAEPDNVHRFYNTRGCLEIMTDYIIEIEDQFRGDDVETMRIRGPGGKLDGYEQYHGIAPELNVGDRYLFFLLEAPASEMLPDAWAFDHQRAREIRAGNEITTGLDSSMTLDEVEQLIQDTLAGESPPPEKVHRALLGSANSTHFDDDRSMRDDT